MADNIRKKGFRWASSKSGSAKPVIETWHFASAFRPTLTITTPVYKDLTVGDPVKKLASGYLDICAGQESDTPDTIVYGICMGFNIYNSTDGVMEWKDTYPNAGTAYGTNFDRQTEVLVCPADTAYWQVDFDDATTATTYAAYLALRGSNMNHTFNATSLEGTDTIMDVSTTNTTSTLLWRLVDVDRYDPENQDFSGLYVKGIFEVNSMQGPAWSATGL